MRMPGLLCGIFWIGRRAGRLEAENSRELNDHVKGVLDLAKGGLRSSTASELLGKMCRRYCRIAPALAPGRLAASCPMACLPVAANSQAI